MRSQFKDLFTASAPIAFVTRLVDTSTYPMPAPSALSHTAFLGRDDYVQRFNARVGHFRFFLYEGIEGVGKTALMLHLAHEPKLGATTIVHLTMAPGESPAGIIARARARLPNGADPAYVQGDAFRRLVTSTTNRLVLLLMTPITCAKTTWVPLSGLFGPRRARTWSSPPCAAHRIFPRESALPCMLSVWAPSPWPMSRRNCRVPTHPPKSPSACSPTKTWRL